ncbi:hypothetical protein EVAR_102370_1 [Eumeta japonica]|uniref:Uncharacterized protein n=1 Tax=Eumeta variegata TaxID=151549 RepID=A0A4C1SFV0_EUMVA|nr:hypothetical protein EVAR_102370_1 [Eumeta japonica]
MAFTIRRALGCGRRALADPFGVPGPTSTRADRRSERLHSANVIAVSIWKSVPQIVKANGLKCTVMESAADGGLRSSPRHRSTWPNRAGPGRRGVTFGIVVARVGNFFSCGRRFPGRVDTIPKVRVRIIFVVKIFVTKMQARLIDGARAGASADPPGIGRAKIGRR